ncbi:SDR family oxidoreductase [Pediococcus claussenii]|uniref:NAD dependent epimerase/dehydratase family protein n=1 Tax=Pediococcus claussenii (strain ATCC BAA-344 / DSM 14800 / JCM 18046 / KCTC 3811 / LMG 21948 / P06) TaxID=701521 RepID=G8PBB7_PEDCP|nr:SDR family oxidoreductase [Pediococcus claussenii]AEV95906.1 NAD dependent epimerase/dehydratase family protein [Pediococcus claussenii ATCC BAA-344]ANZ69397.1 NAD-dependent dehydratase [Pediococcus claussenii]ANZ71217.1 NAD-dependent dehydratase [Pediococcus claussenii]KRN20511.1 hypothetical protein IV79_GL000568 [Pediococcus claussenii]
MSNILILGANGSIAEVVEEMLLKNTSDQVTLFMRTPSKLGREPIEGREKIIQGDVTNYQQILKAVQGQDIVYANLLGTDSKLQAEMVIKAMEEAHIERLVWVSVLGIYNEVPGKFGEWNNEEIYDDYIKPYAEAAEVIEKSNIKYTLIRPAWLTYNDEVDYELTQKGETFKGTEVSRKSVADFIVKIIQDPSLEVNHSVGIDKPGTDGDKPAWF